MRYECEIAIQSARQSTHKQELQLFVERSHTNLDQDAPLIRKLGKALETTQIQGSRERIYEPGVKFVA